MRSLLFRLPSFWILLAIALPLALAIVAWRLLSRPLALRIADSSRIPIARGPLGDLLHAVQSASLRGSATLVPGTYRFRHAGRELTIEADAETSVSADLDFQIAAVGESKRLGPWIEPRIGTCRLEFSRPVRIGAGRTQVAVTSLGLRTGRDKRLAGEVEPAYAETLGSLFVSLLQGGAAPSSAMGSTLDRMVSVAEIQTAALRLEAGASLPVGGSRLVVGPDSQAELNQVRVVPHAGEAAGDFRASLALAGGSRIAVADLRIEPRAARMDVAGAFRIGPEGGHIELEQDSGGSLTVQGGTIDVGGALRLEVGRASLGLTGLTASVGPGFDVWSAVLNVSEGRLDLAEGTTVQLGPNAVALGAGSALRVRDLRAPGDGRVEGVLQADLSLATGTTFDLHGLRVRPGSGTMSLPIRFRKGPGSLWLGLDRPSSDLTEQPDLSLEGASLEFEAGGSVGVRVGRIEAQVVRWTHTEGTGASQLDADLELDAQLSGGSLGMPVGGGSLALSDLRVPKVKAVFHRGGGRDAIRVDLPAGLELGHAQWRLAGADGSTAQVDSAGLTARAVTATAWNELALDLSTLDLRPSRLVLADRAGQSIRIDVGEGSTLTAAGPLVITPADPRRSTLPALDFRGKKLGILADIDKESRLGLTDVDAQIRLEPGGVLALRGSMHGRLQSEGLPGGVAALVAAGRLRVEDLDLSLEGGRLKASLGRIEVSLPREPLLNELRTQLASPIPIPDQALDVDVPGLLRDARAAGMSAKVALPSLTIGRDQAEFAARADVRGRVDARRRTVDAEIQKRSIGRFSIPLPKLEAGWSPVSRLIDFDATVSASGRIRFEVIGAGASLLDRRLRFDLECNEAHLDHLGFSSTVVEAIVKAIRTVAGRIIEDRLKQSLSRELVLDPWASLSLSEMDRAWLSRIQLQTFAVDASEGDVLIRGSGEVRAVDP
jgi:hypothetical protein